MTVNPFDMAINSYDIVGESIDTQGVPLNQVKFDGNQLAIRETFEKFNGRYKEDIYRGFCSNYTAEHKVPPNSETMKNIRSYISRKDEIRRAFAYEYLTAALKKDQQIGFSMNPPVYVLKSLLEKWDIAHVSCFDGYFLPPEILFTNLIAGTAAALKWVIGSVDLTSQRTDKNILIYGSSGSGKSRTIECIAWLFNGILIPI